MNKWIHTGFVFVLWWVGAVVAAEVPRAQPEEVGFSAERLHYIDKFYAEKVNKGEMAGAVTLIARRGKVVHFNAVGYADVERKQTMQTDAIFRLYSMTKPIAATALMMLYEEGRFQMQDPLSKYIPEFANLKVLRAQDAAITDTVPLERPPTVQDALRHTAGFSHGLSASALDAAYIKENVFGLDVTLAQMMTKLAKLPLMQQPGTALTYSVGPDIDARLVEVLSGMSFDEFLDKRLFKPLGMKDAGFWVGKDKAKRLATVHWTKDGKLTPLDEAHGHPDTGQNDGVSLLLFQPQSVNSYTANHRHKGGSFGLLGTAEDYWRFGQAMLNGGELDGARILSPQTVRYMVRDHLSSIEKGKQPGGGWGLGFSLINDPVAAGAIGNEGTFQHGGAATTYCWIDPKEQLVVVIMTQHLGVPTVAALAGQMRTLVYGALLQ